MSIPQRTCLLFIALVACTENRVPPGDEADAAASDDGGSGEGGANGADEVCDYKPKLAPVWSATIDPAPESDCTPRALDVLRCDVIGSDGVQTLELQCADEDQSPYHVTLAGEEPLPSLPLEESDTWTITYRPDIRGDNGSCPYALGTFVIRERASERLLLALVNSNEPQQDLSDLLAPLEVDIDEDDCAEEVTHTCFEDWEDKRQALVVSFAVERSERSLRAGEAATLADFEIDVQQAADDRGHPCCIDCGSGASSLAFSVRRVE